MGEHCKFGSDLAVNGPAILPKLRILPIVNRGLPAGPEN